jgi:hypothetical protein
MADTLPIIKLPDGGQWLDLYGQSGIGVGASVCIQCLNDADVNVSIQATEPDPEQPKYRLLTKGQEQLVETGASGLWARSFNGGTVNLEVRYPERRATTAFGETLVAEPTPAVQMAANYGLTSKAFILTTGESTAIAEDSLFKAKTAAAPGVTAAILTDHQLTYRAGQGASNPFTAKFSPGVAGSEQVAGLIASTDGFGFGYNGEEFGILHAHDGKNEIQELTVTTPAAGAEDATVTINGTPYTVPLTASNEQTNAKEIAASLNTQVPSYEFTANGAQVVAVDFFARPQGAFAFSSATAVAAWGQIVAGVAQTNDWVPFGSWNVSNPSWINPQKGGVFRIQFQYLGFGGIEFEAENEETSDFEVVHRIKYANNHDLPSVTNPTFRLGWAATNTTNNTEVEVSGASTAGFIEGKVILTEDPISIAASILALGQVQTSLLTIRNRVVLNEQRNRAELFPLKVSASVDSSKGAILEAIKYSDVPDPGMTFEYYDKGASITEFSTDQVAVSGGRIVDSLPVSINGGVLNLKEIGLHLLPGEYLVIAMAQNGTPAEPARIVLTSQEDL